MWEFKNKNNNWVPIKNPHQQKYLTREYHRNKSTAAIDLWKIDFRKMTMHDLNSKKTYNIRYNGSNPVRVIQNRTSNKRTTSTIKTRSSRRKSNITTRSPIKTRSSRRKSNRKTQVPVYKKTVAQKDVNARTQQNVTFAPDTYSDTYSDSVSSVFSKYFNKNQHHGVNKPQVAGKKTFYDITPSITPTPTYSATPSVTPTTPILNPILTPKATSILTPKAMSIPVPKAISRPALRPTPAPIPTSRPSHRSVTNTDTKYVTLPVFSAQDLHYFGQIINASTLNTVIYYLKNFFGINIKDEILYKLTPNPFTKVELMLILKHCAYLCTHVDTIIPHHIEILQAVNRHNKAVVLTRDQCCCLLSLAFFNLIPLQYNNTLFNIHNDKTFTFKAWYDQPEYLKCLFAYFSVMFKGRKSNSKLNVIFQRIVQSNIKHNDILTKFSKVEIKHDVKAEYHSI